MHVQQQDVLAVQVIDEAGGFHGELARLELPCAARRHRRPAGFARR